MSNLKSTSKLKLENSLVLWAIDLSSLLVSVISALKNKLTKTCSVN